MRTLALCGLLFSFGALAQQVTDGAGRKLVIPAKVERVYAAGPPASMLVFAIAPDKLVGWTRAFRPNEAAFVAWTAKRNGLPRARGTDRPWAMAPRILVIAL